MFLRHRKESTAIPAEVIERKWEDRWKNTGTECMAVSKWSSHKMRIRDAEIIKVRKETLQNLSKVLRNEEKSLNYYVISVIL